MKTTSLKPLACGLTQPPRFLRSEKTSWRVWGMDASLTMAIALALALAAGLSTPSHAAVSAADTDDAKVYPTKKTAPPAVAAKSMDEQVRSAVESRASAKSRLTLVVNGKEKKFITVPANEATVPAKAAPKATPNAKASAARAALAETAPPLRAVYKVDSQQYTRAKAAALTGRRAPAPTTPDTTAQAPQNHDVHWHYEGENGPQAWGQLKPEFKVCAAGKRQSPIHIEESSTLQGPAEPLQFNYQPSTGTVVNNGHTIQVDVVGNNSLTVRDTQYKLIQFHFHHPAEERVNGQGFAMVAHLVHQSAEGQLAVVAVLIDPGATNALINKVWTYLPLDTDDRVRLPAGLIDMNELLPKDQRYYQFMGSLTTPPCSEGVLWLVLKQANTASPAQIKLFSQLFPNNARPVQPVNDRPVRDAQ